MEFAFSWITFRSLIEWAKIVSPHFLYVAIYPSILKRTVSIRFIMSLFWTLEANTKVP